MEPGNGKVTQEQVMTAIVGSYPKPTYVSRRSGRKLLDEVGSTFYELEEEIGAQEFKKRSDKPRRWPSESRIPQESIL